MLNSCKIIVYDYDNVRKLGKFVKSRTVFDFEKI